MGFVEAIQSFYERYFDFQTRSSRSEYWWVQLYLIIVIIVLVIVIGVLGGFEDGSEPSGLLIAVIALAWLGHVIPGFAVQVRRFHDQDKSGWFILLGFIPYIGGIIVLVFMLLQGTPGGNRFGEDPLGSMYDTFS